MKRNRRGHPGVYWARITPPQRACLPGTWYSIFHIPGGTTLWRVRPPSGNSWHQVDPLQAPIPLEEVRVSGGERWERVVDTPGRGEDSSHASPMVVLTSKQFLPAFVQELLQTRHEPLTSARSLHTKVLIGLSSNGLLRRIIINIWNASPGLSMI